MASFAEAVKHDPDVRAEAQSIAAELGVSPDAVEQNRDVLRQYLRARDERSRRLAAINPVLNRHMADIEFARIAHDDVANLGAWERLFAQWNIGQLEYEQGVLGEKLRSNQATPQDLERLAAVRARIRAMPRPAGFLEGAAKVLGQQAQSLPRALEVGVYAGGAAATVAMVAGQAGPQVLAPEEVLTVPGAAVAGFTSGVLGAMGAQAYMTEAGNAYLDMLDQGYDRSAASAAAAGVGLANAALELVGVKLLAKGAGLTGQALRETLGQEVRQGVAQAMARPTMAASAQKFAVGYATGLGGEVATEVMQEGVAITAEEIARRLSADPNALSSTVTRGEVVQRLVDTAVQAAQGMALLAAPGPTFQLYRDARRAAAAEHTAQFFREMGTAGEASKVTKRNVGAAERFLADAAAGTAAASTYIDGKAMAEVLRQSDAAATEQGKLQVSWLDQLDRAIPGLAQKIRDAAARGEDVVIPTSEVGAKLAGTEIYQALLPHMRLDAEAMSLAEAQVFRQQERERAAEAEKILAAAEPQNQAFAASARQIEESMRQQLLAAGRLPEVARTDAKLYRDMAIVMAERLGVLPHETEFARVRVMPAPGDAAAPATMRQPAAQGGPVDGGGDGADNVRPDAAPERQAPGPRPVPPVSGEGGAAAAAGSSRWEASSDVRGTYGTRTTPVEAFERELGTDVVTTPAEAAQAMAYLGRGAVERFDALVTDARGRPLAIVGSFKGAVAEAPAFVSTIVAEAFRIRGAANIWFAHNHPSGDPALSPEDVAMSRSLARAFEGSRIQPRGIFAIGGSTQEARAWSYEGGESGVTAPAIRPTKVSVLERVIEKDGKLGKAFSGPVDAWQFAKSVSGGEAGAVLLNAKNLPIAFVPVDPSEMNELRRDDRMDGLYRAVSVANAKAAVIVDNGKLRAGQATNLARLFTTIQVDVLDVVDTSARAPSSWTMQGRQIDASQTFRSGDRGFYRPADFTIFLTKEQNESTFLHELAHHYLSVLAGLARQKENPVLLDDFRTLLDWFGVADVQAWDALGFAGQEQLHERFARSFELWLWEGKAPVPQLEGIFARVAKWMRRIYGTIVGEINAQYRAQFGEDLPALTPAVRSVMARMVASEQDIDAASAVHSMAETFASQAEAGMDDATWAEHQALVDEARQQAVTDHTRDSLREMQWLSNARAKLLRGRQKQHDATRARVRDEVESELRRLPVYRAKLWLERGLVGDIDGGAPAKVVGTHKLQTEATMALLPEGTDAKALGGRRGILAKDGLLPDVAARLFGFETGRDLVAAVLAARPFDDVVDEQTDARMLAEFGELADPKRRELAVMRALHNEARTRLIAVDLRHIGKSLGPVRLLVQAAKEQAKKLIATRQIHDISPRDHLQAEARAARAFAEALRKGDVAAAVQAQQTRLLQHELAKVAGAAIDEVDNAVDDVPRFFTSDEKLGSLRDIDLVYAGRVLAAAFGLGPPMQTAQERQLVQTAMQTVRQNHAVLASRVDALLTLQASGVRSWRELRLEAFRELAETMEALWNQAGKSKQLELQGRRLSLAAVVDAGVAQIDALPRRLAPGSRADAGQTPGRVARWVLKGWHVLAQLKRFEHWTWFMDGGQAGWWTSTFVRPLRDALARYRAQRDQVIGELHPRLMELQRAAGARWDAEIRVPEADLGRSPLVLRGVKELVGMLLHAGNLSSLTKLLVPYGFAEPPAVTGGDLITTKWDQFLARAFREGLLTQREVEFVRFVWSTYERLLPEDQKTHKALYGFEFRTLELQDLYTPWGAVPGGYVPAYVDWDKVDQRRPQASALLETEENWTYSVSTGRGHTLARNPNYQKPLALDVALQVQHIDSHLRFTYLQPTIANILRVVRHREFDAAIRGYDREAIDAILIPMLENTALQSTTRPGIPLVDAIAKSLRAGASLAALGFNLLNSLIQLAGVSNARAALPGRWLRAGVATLFSDRGKAVDFAIEHSAAMRERLDQTTRVLRDDISRAGAGSELARRWRHLQQLGGRAAFWPQRILQGTVDLVTWHGAYQQHVAQSAATELDAARVHAEAVAHADSVVRRTQGSGNPEDVAAYEAGTPLMQLFTQFGSYSNVVLNSILGAQGWRGRLGAIGWVILVPALAEMVVRAMAQGVPDDDKDGEKDLADLANLYVGSLTRNVTGLVPAAGPMLLSLAESDGARMVTSPAGSTLQAAWRGLQQLLPDDDGARPRAATGADARAVGTLLTLLTGLPVMPAARAVGYQIDVDRGKAQPTGTADYLRGLVVGR